MPIPSFAPSAENAISLEIIPEQDFESWMSTQEAIVKEWLDLHGFKAKLGQAQILPTLPRRALVGYGDQKARFRARFSLASGLSKLPKGVYKIVNEKVLEDPETEVFGALMDGYRFERYRSQSNDAAVICSPELCNAEFVEKMVAAECLTRDLVNTPASDLGPDALETAARELAQEFAAKIDVYKDDEMLRREFPMIHAVGRASEQAPRLIDIKWGASGPKITLVGKGVCFDTGGLNIKPGASMGLMKKDMGGAANVLGLARLIMSSELNVQLRVLVPAVENAIAGNAFRPGDILRSRKGLSVEINNTDAEGRLVLGDALALAAEDNPDFIISMATLTGAARVAVGPDLAPFFCDDEAFTKGLKNAAGPMRDPVWQMPFWDSYESLIEPGIADLDNAPSGGMAGSITAALFLRRFVDRPDKYAHFDIYSWSMSAKPGRSKGAFGQGGRAIYAALKEVYDL